MTRTITEECWNALVAEHNDASALRMEVDLLRQAIAPLAWIGEKLPACLPDDARVMFGRDPIYARTLRQAHRVYTQCHYDSPAPRPAADMVPVAGRTTEAGESPTPEAP